MKNLLLALVFCITATVGNATTISDVEKLYEQRDNSEMLDSCISVCAQLVANEGNNDAAVYLSKAYYYKASQATEKDDKLANFDAGYKAGEAVLLQNAAYAVEIDAKNIEAAAAVLTAADIEALYWTAANLARYGKFTSFSKKLKVKGKIRALWDRVLELDPNYNYGGAYRFFGGYFALVPSITGDQDPAKSKEMFDKAVESAPSYLATKVLYAEAYCAHPSIKNQELFDQLLKEVQEADISGDKDILPENKVAKEQAAALIAKRSELFED